MKTTIANIELIVRMVAETDIEKYREVTFETVFADFAENIKINRYYYTRRILS